MGWFKLADSTGLIRQEKFGSKSSCFLHKLEVHQKKWAVLMAWRLMYIISKRDTHKKCWSSHILLIRCLCKPYSNTQLFSQSQGNMFPFISWPPTELTRTFQISWLDALPKNSTWLVTWGFFIPLLYDLVSLVYLYLTSSVSGLFLLPIYTSVYTGNKEEIESRVFAQFLPQILSF